MKLESLPPTSIAAYFHSLRCYYQIQYWRENYLELEEWSWQRTSRGLESIMYSGQFRANAKKMWKGSVICVRKFVFQCIKRDEDDVGLECDSVHASGIDLFVEDSHADESRPSTSLE